MASNTSPIIALARVGRLDLLASLFDVVLLPPAVKGECIDRGKEIGADDVYEIEKGLDAGWITVVPLEEDAEREAGRLQARAAVGRGEAEAIALARMRGVAVILDDADARAAARSLGLEHMGTVMVPYHAFVRGLVSHRELVSILADLSRVLWVAPDVIAEMLRRAEGGNA